VPVGLTAVAGEFATQWNMIMTGAAVATLPVLAVFVLLQKYIIRGVILSGVKG
jgi:multiple sugar transport system permease protein